ncbi:MAG: VIT1/CCC1 transporter family protein [Candidatus Nanoarchaeia archaeon]
MKNFIVNSRAGYYIKSIVYGGIDGIITTFAVVTGAAGAGLSAGVIIILGFANLIADGISMAVGDYLSTKSENEFTAQQKDKHEQKLKDYPEQEKKRTISLFINKGFSKEDSQKLAQTFSHNPKAWLDFKLKEELEMNEDESSPLKNAFATFFSFLFFGFMPLFIYVISLITFIEDTTKLIISIILTGITMFLLGTLKSLFSTKHWFRSGLEILILGGVAASVAYGVGVLLRGLA